jgi:CheY-like chemotaxis protein
VTKRVVWSEQVRSRVESGPGNFTHRASMETVTADGLESFLSLVVSEPTDLVVLDLCSPELPAVEACLRLRADRRTARIPVLVMAGEAADADALSQSGCNEVIPAGIDPRILQEKIAGALGLRLRRHPRFPVVLPVARGRIFHEFLGYSNSLSESGMGFDTIARIRSGDELNLKIYRSTEEKPISVAGRVCGVRPNMETGVGYSVGVEFVRLASPDKQRLVDLFPQEPCVTWGSDAPGDAPVGELSAQPQT